ncbi:MAG: hypothetical protein KatS3mg087_0516 [Patescibacteria group bacterium]|nr:MAG: hypothetical protein KatS3mg087_0516 [Patescibacteria group bacterium]
MVGVFKYLVQFFGEFTRSPFLLVSPVLFAFQPAVEDFAVVTAVVLLFVAIHTIMRLVNKNRRNAEIVDDLLREYAKYSVMVGLDENEVKERVEAIRKTLGIKSDDASRVP